MTVPKGPPDLSVVILCYRAEEFVPLFVNRMKAALETSGVSYELVLVANYHADAKPADRTPDVARGLTLGDPTLSVVAEPKRGMMGWDMRTGLAAARGRTIAVIDGDGQMPAEDVVAVFNCLNAGGFDMAMTYREQRYDGFTRYVISRVYNRTLKTLFPSVSVRDANSKPKIFTRDALDRLALASDGWFIDAEMVIQATRMGFRIGEVATRFHRNSRRRSFVRPKAIIEFAANLVVYRLRTLRR